MGMVASRLVFEIGAGIYDWLTRQDTWRTQCRSLVDHFADALPTERPLDVLDVGTGPAMSAIGIVDRLPQARVVGIDFSHRMIERAERNVQREGYAIELRQADATALPFEDGSFDVVTACSFIYLVADRERVLGEIRRVLRPGGRCVFLEPHARAPRTALLRLRGDIRFRASMVAWRVASRQAGRFTADTLRALLERCEFGHVGVVPTLGGLGLVAHGVRG